MTSPNLRHEDVTLDTEPGGLVASAVFLLLPVFYGFTSHGHDHPATLFRRGRDT